MGGASMRKATRRRAPRSSPAADVHHVDLDRGLLAVPLHRQRHLLSDSDALELLGQVCEPAHRLAVHTEEPGTVRRMTTPSTPARVAAASLAATMPIPGVGTEPRRISSGTTRLTESIG